MSRQAYIITLISLSLLFSCNTKKLNKNELFTVLGKNETNITFNNQLDENTFLNGFVYEYYYNGAGVATADFNNDGLIDIYFVSNRRANHLYLNEGDLEFKNVTKTSNTSGKFGFPTGVTVVDINNDGLMDIYISKSGRIPEKDHLRNELLINTGINSKGIPVFNESAREYGLDLPFNSTQATFFDYDRDGDLDMFIINHDTEVYDEKDIVDRILTLPKNTGERLYKNYSGTFSEVTVEAGIISNKLAFTLGVSIGDVNNDGWPDIFTGNDYAEKDHLYINNQNGSFTETSLNSLGHISNFSMGNDMADINNDGRLDIMTVDMSAQDNFTQKTSMSGMSVERFFNITDIGLHHQYMYNALHLNNGVDFNSKTPVFSNIEHLSGVSSTDWSWAPLLFDMNNDGRKDIFVSNGVKRDFRNNDFKLWHKRFHEEKRKEALKKGGLDKHKYMKEVIDKLPTRKKANHFFLNNGDDLVFNAVKFSQPETNSNGAAYADFDNDGDIDIVVNNSDDNALIYRNNSDEASNYLKLKLKGNKKNIDAVGARVELISNNKKQIVENYFTRGFQSAMATPLHFGLGNSKKVDTLKIVWPNGKTQIQYNVMPNQMLTINYNPNEDLDLQKSLENDKLFSASVDSLFLFKHKENLYNDFEKESLIPHKMSKMGPGLTVSDVNGDGLDDFYIGGAKDQAGALYIQTKAGEFIKSNVQLFEKDKMHEDTGALFFDADQDGDQDLYVVSGGNEEEPNALYYQDRFYENKGRGRFVKTANTIPEITTSGLKVTAGDYDNDGDLDLFVGSRVKPIHYGQYAKSYILENKNVSGKIKFVDKTDVIAPQLIEYTMVTDALWVDYNNDSHLDLIVSNEWGNIDIFENQNKAFINVSKKLDTQRHKGWWFSLAADDIDNNGTQDLIAGNLGLNYKYKATEEAPFYMYLNDFDKNNSNDIVLAYHEKEKVYPLRGRECTSNQMPYIKEKFKTYESFGNADINKVYGDALEESIQYKATNFASGIFRNKDNKQFNFTPFKNTVQLSSINKILIEDFDDDGNKDLVLLGNLYASEVETPRNDASYGHFMKGNGEGNFKVMPAHESGLYVKGDVKDAAVIYIGAKEKNNKSLLIAKNNDFLQLINTNVK